MPGGSSKSRPSILRLILIPGLISLAVTILRLVGEVHQWSKTFFNPEPGGEGALVGIIWLAPVFGIYFALRLSREGQGPESPAVAIGLVLLGVALAVGGRLLVPFVLPRVSFEGLLIYLWIVAVAAGALQYPAWPQFFKAMTAYAYLARVPVVVVMFFAFRGNWSTHYDAVPPILPPDFGFWQKFIWLGFIPQLTFWVGLTILAGSLFGSITAALARAFRRTPQPAS